MRGVAVNLFGCERVAPLSLLTNIQEDLEGGALAGQRFIQPKEALARLTER